MGLYAELSRMHIMSSAAVVDSADRMPGLNINVGNVAANTSTNSREVDWSSNGPSSFLLGQLPRNDKVPIACRRGILFDANPLHQNDPFTESR
jgi:hypothetical protein